jgi:hypothetical protein
MSTQITTAMRNQFSEDVYHLAQQKASRLMPAVTVEDQPAEFAFYDQIGAVTPVERTSRHADTPFTEVPHSRRRVGLRDFEMGEIIDSQDRLRLAFDPAGRYVQAFGYAMGRQMDQVIIDSFFANADTGKTGATSVAFPAGQQIAVDFVESGSTTNSSLTVGKLRQARQLLLDAEAAEEDEELYIVCSQREISALMRTAEVGSRDYNEIQPLVSGNVDNFMGFRFIRVAPTRLPIDGSSNRRIAAWSKTGMLFTRGEGPITNAAPDPTKGFNTRIHMKASFGATRMEEARVVEIKCHPTTF